MTTNAISKCGKINFATHLERLTEKVFSYNWCALMCCLTLIAYNSVKEGEMIGQIIGPTLGYMPI